LAMRVEPVSPGDLQVHMLPARFSWRGVWPRQDDT
jgi:hypothetical protein